MPDHENPGSGRQGGSLLSLAGAGGRGAGKERGSLLSNTGAGEQDRVLRHRLARSRREARPNPLLHALALKPDEIDAEMAADVDADFEAHGGTGGSSGRRKGTERAGRKEQEDLDYNAVREGQNSGGGDTGPYDDPRPLVDPIKVINGIARSKRLIAAMTIAGALIGVAVALSTPKHYEAVAEILIDPRNIKLVDRELVSSDVSQNTAIAIVENQVRIMTSGAVTAKVVDRLNLDTDPEFNGSQSGFGLTSLISELRSLLARSDGGSAGGRQHAIAVQNLLENLEVARSGKTFVVTVGVKTQNPEKSALIANAIVDVFLDYSGSSFSSTASRAADELGAKLGELRAAVEEAERKVEAYKGENDLIDARGHLIGDDEILRLNDQLATARARTIELSAKAASARSLDPDSVLGGALPEGVSSGLITELRSQYADLLRQANQASVKFGAKHPESRAIEAQLAGAREQLRSELRRIAASMQVELKRAVQLEQKLASRLAELKARQVNVSDDMVTLRELERDAATKRAVYESYLLRARETGEQKDLNSTNMSIISPASPPLEAIGPSRSMISIAGMIAGFLLGVGLGAIRGAADGVFGGSPPYQPRRRQRPPSPAGDARQDHGRDAHVRESRYAAESPPGHDPLPPKAEPRGGREENERQQPVNTATGPFNAVPPYAAGAYHFAPAYPPYGPFAGAPFAPVIAPYSVAMMPSSAYPATAMYPPVYPGAPATPVRQPESEPEAEREPRESRPSRRQPRNRVEAIRDDLREVRNAIHDLAERRAKRRV